MVVYDKHCNHFEKKFIPKKTDSCYSPFRLRTDSFRRTASVASPGRMWQRHLQAARRGVHFKGRVNTDRKLEY